jgi:hypothetical protein
MRSQWFVSAFVLLGLLALGAAAVAQPPDDGAGAADGQAVLAAGDYALTRDMVSRFAGFIEWLLDVPLTSAQRQEVEASLLAAWQSGDQQEIQDVVETLALEADVSRLTEAERALVREQAQPGLLEELRKTPDTEAAQWVLAVYESGHQPLADGDPPLTRQVTDSYAELLCFMLGEVIGQSFEAPQDFKDRVAQELVARYPDLTAEQRQELAGVPLQWAALRVVWPELPDEQKAEYRAQWTESFQPMLPPDEPVAAQPQQGDETASGTSADAPQDPMAQQRAMAAQLQYSQMLNNVMQMQMQTSQIISSNIGGNWTYQYRY